jgi:hypothetical protein
MAASFEDGPLWDRLDLNVVRQNNPEILSFRSLLKADPQQALEGRS